MKHFEMLLKCATQMSFDLVWFMLVEIICSYVCKYVVSVYLKGEAEEEEQTTTGPEHDVSTDV